MVFVDLEGVISKSRNDPFAALAANILLDLDLNLHREQIEKDLTGKVMLSLLDDDKNAFLECAEVIQKRNLTDDSDQWAYNEYLAFFIVYAALKWPEGIDPAKRIVEYRVRISKDDNRAQELQDALKGNHSKGLIQFSAAQASSKQALPAPSIANYESIKNWLSGQQNLNALDRILLATVQKGWVKSLIVEDPKEREALADAAKSIYSIAATHAMAEYWLSFTATLLLSILFVLAYFIGPPALKAFLLLLLSMGLIAPFSLVYAHFKWRENFIRYRTTQIFTQLSGHPESAYKQTLDRIA